MPTSLVTRMNELEGRLTVVERKIAEYFAQNLQELPGIGMPAVAKSCGVSKAAIVRMCKKLGYTGYKELRQALTAELALAKAQDRPEAITSLQGLPVTDVCRKFMALSADIVRGVQGSMQVDQYEQATMMINQHPHIRILGWDATTPLTLEAENSLILMGFATTLASCEHLRAASLKAIKAGELVLMVASERHLEEVNLARQMISEAGGFSIIITTMEKQHPPIQGSLLVTSTLKGHLSNYGPLESMAASRLMLKTLLLAVASSRPDIAMP